MIKKLNIKISILLISIIIISSYFFTSLIIGKDKFNNLKSLLNDEQKQLIKKYIFPYKLISEQKLIISKQQKAISKQQEMMAPFFLRLELQKKDAGSDIVIKESVTKLSNNLTLKKYQLTSGFYAGINSSFPGSGFIDFFD